MSPRRFTVDEVPTRLFGRRVRVWDAQEHGTLVEGVVIAYTDRPTVVVREDSGRQHSWIVDLPIDVLDDEPKPNLGLATTGELLNELAARIEVDGASGGGGLGYSTVFGRSRLAEADAARFRAANEGMLG